MKYIVTICIFSQQPNLSLGFVSWCFLFLYLPWGLFVLPLCTRATCTDTFPPSPLQLHHKGRVFAMSLQQFATSTVQSKCKRNLKNCPPTSKSSGGLVQHIHLFQWCKSIVGAGKKKRKNFALLFGQHSHFHISISILPSRYVTHFLIILRRQIMIRIRT